MLRAIRKGPDQPHRDNDDPRDDARQFNDNSKNGRLAGYAEG